MTKKPRTPVPQDISAEILFLSDRTCCVCRDNRKKVQIHHIDENHNNHEKNNLAVLCLECHNETQISGGFGRKLDAHQIRLYRNNWHKFVAENRDVKKSIEIEGIASNDPKKVEKKFNSCRC
jgi:5-methylcytosine-specific restriction endonuclease McrA